MTIDMPPPVPQAPTDQPAPVPAAPTSTVGVRLRDNPVLRHELIERVQGE